MNNTNITKNNYLKVISNFTKDNLRDYHHFIINNFFNFFNLSRLFVL